MTEEFDDVELEESESREIERIDNTITALEELVAEDSKKLAEQLVRENDLDNIKNLTKLFNVNIAKKNVLRVNKLNELVDNISDEMICRVKTNPEDISNKDLKDFLTTVTSVLEKSSKIVDGVSETPAIQFNQQNNNITINSSESELNREERERVLNLVSAILSASNGKIEGEEDND